MNFRFANLWHAILFAASLSLVAGCTNPGVGEFRNSSVKPFIPPNANSYTIENNQKFIVGRPLGRLQVPLYPHAVQVDRAEVSVCLEVSVDRHGIVYQSTPLVAIPSCPAKIEDVAPELVSGAQRATKEWRFVPSKLCTYPVGYDATAVNLNCDGPVIRIELIPIKLAFRFEFIKKPGTDADVVVDSLKN